MHAHQCSWEIAMIYEHNYEGRGWDAQEGWSKNVFYVFSSFILFCLPVYPFCFYISPLWNFSHTFLLSAAFSISVWLSCPLGPDAVPWWRKVFVQMPAGWETERFQRTRSERRRLNERIPELSYHSRRRVKGRGKKRWMDGLLKPNQEKVERREIELSVAILSA